MQRAARTACLVPVFLRLGIGMSLLAASLEKLQHLSAFVAAWHEMRLPLAGVAAPAFAIFGCGAALLLLAGWQARTVAGLLMIQLVAEILLTKRPLAKISEYTDEWQLAWMALAVTWLGVGSWSLDGFLERRRARAADRLQSSAHAVAVHHAEWNNTGEIDDHRLDGTRQGLAVADATDQGG